MLGCVVDDNLYLGCCYCWSYD